MRGHLISVVAVTAALAAAPAQASTVTAGIGGLTYNASSGESNQVTIEQVFGQSLINVADTGASIQASAGCLRLDSHHASCSSSDFAENYAFSVNLADESDGLTLTTLAAVVLIEGGSDDDKLAGSWNAKSARIEGGSGDDDISRSTLNDVVEAGSGDDTVRDPAFVSCPLGFNNTTPARNVDGESGNDTLDLSKQYACSNQTATGFKFAIDDLDSIENVIGSPADDTITGSSGENRIDGGGGADTISGRVGDDTLIGGSTSFCCNHLKGGAGDDTLTGGPGMDILEGGKGNDVSRGKDGDDTIVAGAGRDDDLGGAGTDIVSYASYKKPVTVTQDGARDGARKEKDTLGGFEKIIGGSGGDRLQGTGAAETFEGGSGDDRIQGKGGADVLFGEGGADRLDGGDGKDTLDGGAAGDTLSGAAGDDTLTGGLGNDDLRGGDGTDYVSYDDDHTTAVTVTKDNVDNDGNESDQAGLHGITSQTPTEQQPGPTGVTLHGRDNVRRDVEIVEGSNADDTLRGGPGNDTFYGSGGIDVIEGGLGDDALFGNAADFPGFSTDRATLRGGPGNDALTGTPGDDTLEGGPGNDTLTGNGGTDQLACGPDADTVTDREPSEPRDASCES